MKTSRLFLILLACLMALLTAFGTVSAEEAAQAPEIQENACFAPDFEQWGIQNNHGWFYLSQATDGSYTEMSYFPTSDIAWQQLAFASDPFAVGEMYFINKNSFFTGENGSKPVYAFEVPADGRIELAFSTHGQNDMHLMVCLDDTVVRDDISFTTTGADAGFTAHYTRMDVKQGQRLYLIGYTTGSNREGWVKNYSVTYLAPDASLEVDEEAAMAESLEQAAQAAANHEDLGKTWKPDMERFGQQGNENFYYLYKTTAGEYLPMTYWEESEIAWQVHAFASDPGAMGEMFFINQNSGFVGEKGTLPVYAFEAPIGGEIEFSALVHGTGGMAVRLLANDTVVPLNGQDSVTLTTDGEQGGFTRVSATLTVKRGTMLYLELYSEGESREGWVKDYKVVYSAYNAQVEPALQDRVFVPDHDENWGKKENNGWTYMFLDKETGKIRKMAFVRSEDQFKGAEGQAYNFLLILRHGMHPSTGACPSMEFTAPRDGQLRLMVIAKIGAYDMSPTSTGLMIWKNGEKLWPADSEYSKLGPDTLRVILEEPVQTGDTLDVLLEGIDGNVNYDETTVQVLAEYVD